MPSMFIMCNIIKLTGMKAKQRGIIDGKIAILGGGNTNAKN